MDIIKLLDVPVWQLILVIAVGAAVMFSFDYIAPEASPSMFFAATNEAQPPLVMFDDVVKMNSALLGQVTAIAGVFSWLLLRQRLASRSIEKKVVGQ